MSKTTIDQLAGIVQKGFKESDKRTDKKIDDLVKAVEKGFKESDQRMAIGFKESETKTDKKIDDLALMVQKGFEETATKVDLNNLRHELHETREILAQAIKDLEMHFSASLSHKQEEINHLKTWMTGIDERVSFLESRYKIKK